MFSSASISESCMLVPLALPQCHAHPHLLHALLPTVRGIQQLRALLMLGINILAWITVQLQFCCGSCGAGRMLMWCYGICQCHPGWLTVRFVCACECNSECCEECFERVSTIERRRTSTPQPSRGLFHSRVGTPTRSCVLGNYIFIDTPKWI
jgi:hypothetical protein